MLQNFKQWYCVTCVSEETRNLKKCPEKVFFGSKFMLQWSFMIFTLTGEDEWVRFIPNVNAWNIETYFSPFWS